MADGRRNDATALAAAAAAAGRRVVPPASTGANVSAAAIRDPALLEISDRLSRNCAYSNGVSRACRDCRIVRARSRGNETACGVRHVPRTKH